METRRLEILQVIRIAAAILIMVFHSGIAGYHGFCGVEIFNIICGFLLIYSTRNKDKTNNFIIKKIIRIVPLYWVLTLFTYVLLLVKPDAFLMSEANIVYLFKSLFFIPYKNSLGFNVPILSVGWFLNYEMFFIIIFYIAMRINHKHRGLIASLITLFLIILGYVFNFKCYFFEYYFNPYIFEYVFGIMAYHVYDYLKNKNIKSIFLYIILIIYSVCLVIPTYDAFDYGRLILIAVPAFFIVISSLLLFKDAKFNKNIVYLGGVTFSVYLLEYFSTAAFKVVANILNLNITMKIILFIIVVIGTFICAIPVAKIFEDKLPKFLKSKFLKEKTI